MEDNARCCGASAMIISLTLSDTETGEVTVVEERHPLAGETDETITPARVLADTFIHHVRALADEEE
jgi:hypothetical protein